MKSFIHLSLAFVIAALCISPALAAKKDKGQRSSTAALQKKLKKADLPSEARDKASKVLSEHGPKVRAAETARESILTAEQKAARAAAQKAGKEAGKKRKEIAADVAAAMKLSDEQKTKYNAAERDLATAQSDMHKALREVLSADQQAQIGLKNKKRKNA
jgi:hypothetical protein